MRYEIDLEETFVVGSKKLINCDETRINNPADTIPITTEDFLPNDMK